MRLLFAAALLVLAPAAAAQFVNWETPHVHPLDVTPDGTRLLAVNTADNRLMVWDITGPGLVPAGSVEVGLDPVSVRARSNTEAWVVNHISDSISVVDLGTLRVKATIDTDDEPADVVFAASPERAFVSCSQANLVQVWNPANLAAAPVAVPLEGEDPRALATSLDGSKVYVGIFESGNGSTILGGGAETNLSFPPNVVNDPAGPWGGANPPPNDGLSFNPPLNPANPAPPDVGLIVKQDAAGNWMDDNGGDWTALVSGPLANLSGRPVGWTLLDHDVAVIDAATLAVTYVNRLMNIVMALAVNPDDGRVCVVGTEATNEVRFEPVVSGTFTRVELALVPSVGPASIVDLNPHLTYSSPTVAQAVRDDSLGDPRGIAWNAAGTRAYITGMGSNNLVVVDGNGDRAGAADTIEVGEGPTGVVLEEAGDRIYVLNKFEGSISVVDLSSETELCRVPFFDPSPAAIKAGRQHLYGTHETSGLGQVACASCHVDSRMDRLAWDLGDPSGAMKDESDQNLAADVPFFNQGFEDWHPMKGPMLTQTLQDIIGKEPLHWRGDRDGLEEFNGAFEGLQGDDEQLSPAEMQEYESFLATVHFPPNPYRNLDNSLPTNLPLPRHFATGDFTLAAGAPLPNGNAVTGLALFRQLPPNGLDGGALGCVTCHTLPTGVGTDHRLTSLFPPTLSPIPAGPNGERHTMLVSMDGSTNVTMKVPHLRNIYERTGFNATKLTNTSGFGMLHDGSVDTVERFVAEPVFDTASDQEVADLVALMAAFAGSELPMGSSSSIFEPPGVLARDTHAAVGTQTTLVQLSGAPAAQVTLMNAMLLLANGNKVGLVAKGRQAGVARGYRFDGAGLWQSDRAGEVLTTASLQAGAASGSELTFTVVPEGSETRVGIDRDLDGFLDRDELDAGSDPSHALSTPPTWTDLGNGLAGLHGVPRLEGNGALTAGSTLTLTLNGARASTSAALIIGLAALNAPFKGGVLVPTPDVVILGLPTDACGMLLLGGPLPAGLPSLLPIYFQYWITDAAAVKGFSATNAQRATTP